jgi:hypothetical protein
MLMSLTGRSVIEDYKKLSEENHDYESPVFKGLLNHNNFSNHDSLPELKPENHNESLLCNTKNLTNQVYYSIKFRISN